MLFSSKKDKKTSGSKKLTEAEIQRKLYGEYETESAGRNDASHEVKMSGPLFESEVVKKVEPQSREQVASTALGGGIQPKAPVIRPAFSAPKSSVSQTPAVEKNWKPAFVSAGKTALGFLAGVLWKLGTYCIKGIDFVLRLLDPRKPQARRLLYSIVACVMVAALFIGVFRLNNQRKKAMLGEIPKPVAAVVPASSEAGVSPLTAPSSGESSPLSEASQKEESQEMILKALENSAGGAQAGTAAAPTAEAVVGKYVIQVATYAAADDAARIVDSLKQADFESFYKKQIRNSTGHVFFTVYLGRYETYSGAQDKLAKFRKASVARPFQDAFIRTMES